MVEVETRPFTLGGEGVVGTLYLPQVEHAIPGVLLIGGSEGHEPYSSAEWLAQEGVAALSVAFFNRPGLPPALRDIPLEYFERALNALCAALSPRRGPLVVMGASRGSEAAFLTAIHFPDLVSAVVGFDPGNVVLCSWPPGGAAWTVRGRALPYVTRFGPSAADPEAEIPVEKIRGPILLLSSGSDQVWPSTQMAKALISRLQAHGHPYPDEHLDFPLASHGLLRRGSNGVGGVGRTSPSEGESNVDRRAALVKIREFLNRLS